MDSATFEHVSDYLLIGGGLAAATAAAEIRRRDPVGSILIVAADTQLPYHRPPLSKEYLRGEIGSEGQYGAGGVYVQPPRWYAEQRVEVLRGVAAMSLDTRRRVAHLVNGQALGYRALLLATGGRARRLPVSGATLPGVYTLRTLADADALRAELAVPGKRAVVMGSGFIGLETAASAWQRRARVTVIDPLTRPWPGMMPPHLSEYFRGQFLRRGVALLQEKTISAVLAGENGHVGGVRVAPVYTGGRVEEIACDVVIVGIGIQLNTELAETAGLDVHPRSGVIVNDRLETRVAGVFAAGDVVTYPDPVTGMMHFEHWDHAIASGRTAGANMAGGDLAYRHVPYFFSDLFDLSLHMLGYPSSNAEVVVRGDMAADRFIALYVQQGVLRAALMVNDDGQMELLRALIATGAPVADDLRRLADPSFDLAALRP
jgi:3-phenylpropionate/trans-cinnamate dioxygenase ferredoxin reductase subunit